MNSFTKFEIKAPCDFYGHNAWRVSCLSRSGKILSIEKPDEKRACEARSLLGVLTLGVQKEDKIRFIGDENSEDLPAFAEKLCRELSY